MRDGSWFRCKWLGIDNAYIAPGTNPHWEPAWHGCNLEALYSIMYHGELFESSDDSPSQRYLICAPGIYVHKTGTKVKAENYIDFTPLCNDGEFWGCILGGLKCKCLVSMDPGCSQVGERG